MIMDPNRYRQGLNSIKATIIRPIRTPEWRVSELSCVNHIPLLAVVLYALRPDVLGEDPELRRKVKVLCDFYNYTEIIPWEDLPTTS